MKKQTKQLLLSGLALSLLLVLSGCVETTGGVPTGNGPMYAFFVKPMGSIITYFANNMGLGFGLAIVIVTIIVRLIILPLGIYQSWKASYQSEKMAFLSHIFDPINQRMKTASSQEEKLAAQSELMAARKEHGLSLLGGVGCLPILIQMPFFTGLFYAARYTTGVSDSQFLGFNLGEKSLILTVTIAILYFIQSWLSMQGVAPEQRQQMKSMMYMTPLLMLGFSFSLPASVSLYWFVGGIFSIIQQLIVNYIVKPKLRKQIAEEFEKNPPKSYSNSKPRKDVTQSTKKDSSKVIQTNNKPRRNAGKQKRK